MRDHHSIAVSVRTTVDVDREAYRACDSVATRTSVGEWVSYKVSPTSSSTLTRLPAVVFRFDGGNCTRLIRP